ncbi:hypothetical protein BD410DRAFT_730045 [Rickenella mellea]|uniref:F-box domain-containing protein n=1 Tax=Rickenella mellea TaxID=50990 RepID=A0A4Y7PPI7_9AGAM|nr:hypothetical protein BD410DRAFT_730045 [Rickenella mellea]
MGRISFDDVLGTNYVPSHIERCSLKASIESIVQGLSALKHVLSPLLAKRKTLTKSIRAHTALLTPIRRVPPEPIREDFPRPRVKEVPLKLGRICRVWPDITLSTASLWCAIRIPTAWNIEGLREWISRSGSCTLSFTIQIFHENSDHLSLLASYQSRWKEVVFLFRDSQLQFAQEFLGSLAHNYENIHTLKFAYETCGRAQNNIHMVVNSAPNLRNLLL